MHSVVGDVYEAYGRESQSPIHLALIELSDEDYETCRRVQAGTAPDSRIPQRHSRVQLQRPKNEQHLTHFGRTATARPALLR